MKNYEQMEHDVCEFKKYLKMTEDLMVDSFKWLKLSEYDDNYETKEKFKKVSDSLYDMFMVEHERIMNMFKDMH